MIIPRMSDTTLSYLKFLQRSGGQLEGENIWSEGNLQRDMAVNTIVLWRIKKLRDMIVKLVLWDRLYRGRQIVNITIQIKQCTIGLGFRIRIQIKQCTTMLFRFWRHHPIIGFIKKLDAKKAQLYFGQEKEGRGVKRWLLNAT
jgi:hypothetical protein